MAQISLHSFVSTDDIKLPGLLYEPKKKTDNVLIYLHGNGSSSVFYSFDKVKAFGDVLTQNNIAFFPFNNRGAHWFKKLNKTIDGEKNRVLYGMAYEFIKECIFDIDGAIDYLKTLGFTTFYLAGISTGANKIVIYDKYSKKKRVSKYILLSGGDDTGLYYDALGKKKFMQALHRSKREVKKGNGRKLVPKHLVGDVMISYQSLYDTINPDGDYNIFPFNEAMNNLKLSKKPLFGELGEISKPTLIIYGSEDEYCFGNVVGCVNAMKANVGQKKIISYKIVKGADHGFSEKEREVAELIAQWI